MIVSSMVLYGIVVGIISGCDLSIHACHEKLAQCKGKLVLYKPLLYCNSHLKQL